MADEDYEALAERIRQLAALSVGRGCFFAALAIWATMIGLIYDPVLSLKSGAVLTLLTAAVLLLKAQIVTRGSYKRTELWVLLDRKLDLLPAHAQRLVTGSLYEAYLLYALYAAVMGAAFWCLALVFAVLK